MSGKIVLFGSGETAKQGRKVQESLLLAYPKPVRVAIVETPAGFQPNVDVVTAKTRAFYEHNLQNANPIITVVPARRKASEHDPDDLSVAALLDNADVIFAGPGSPTYTVKHLQGSATLTAIRQRLQQGATLILASAAAIASGYVCLPVYEIYKAGDDPFWLPGLDLLGDLGLRLAVVPHWNNAEGGAELDTSRAFMGAQRFQVLLEMLPTGVTVLGIDEHTAVVLDQQNKVALVEGAGGATILTGGRSRRVEAGSSAPLDALQLTPGAA